MAADIVERVYLPFTVFDGEETVASNLEANIFARLCEALGKMIR